MSGIFRFKRIKLFIFKYLNKKTPRQNALKLYSNLYPKQYIFNKKNLLLLLQKVYKK